MIHAQRAAVRPHVIFAGATTALSLEDEVLARLDDKRWGFIVLKGEPGSGKSTALAHLAHVFADDPRLRLADEPEEAEIGRLAKLQHQKLIVCALRHAELSADNVEVWRLAGWLQDDLIEYLLAKHHDRCASVMRRVLDDPHRVSLAGFPELWSSVLDRLAGDEAISNVKSALRCEVEARLTSSEAQSEVCRYCFDALFKVLDSGGKADRLWDLYDVASDAFPLLRHNVVQNLMAGMYLAEQLRLGQLFLLRNPLPQTLIHETADCIREDQEVLESLRHVLTGLELETHAMAASLLHAAGAAWRPSPTRAPLLGGAQLPGIKWQGIHLQFLNIVHADLSEADLSEARIEDTNAFRAHLSDVRFHGAHLQKFRAHRARLDGADLSHVRAPEADFQEADMRNANLEGALLRNSRFIATDLSGARFCRADLTDANLRAAIIEGADFTGANLASAFLHKPVLRNATFTGAQFPRASLQYCDLENMQLPGANFEEAKLWCAHLTGSRMPQANFRGAKLTATGLAEIEWEGADLRDANLSGSTFHMGSSRSGLVGSPLASEGSRTGFYTDELNEQDFKAPEEIRKANLCGADLRGANLGNVDFYLVDLRGALYTPDQEQHFRRCGAILETRV